MRCSRVTCSPRRRRCHRPHTTPERIAASRRREVGYGRRALLVVRTRCRRRRAGARDGPRPRTASSSPAPTADLATSACRAGHRVGRPRMASTRSSASRRPQPWRRSKRSRHQRGAPASARRGPRPHARRVGRARPRPPGRPALTATIKTSPAVAVGPRATSITVTTDAGEVAVRPRRRDGHGVLPAAPCSVDPVHDRPDPIGARRCSAHPGSSISASGPHAVSAQWHTHRPADRRRSTPAEMVPTRDHSNPFARDPSPRRTATSTGSCNDLGRRRRSRVAATVVPTGPASSSTHSWRRSGGPSASRNGRGSSTWSGQPVRSANATDGDPTTAWIRPPTTPNPRCHDPLADRPRTSIGWRDAARRLRAPTSAPSSPPARARRAGLRRRSTNKAGTAVRFPAAAHRSGHDRPRPPRR